MSRRDDHFDAMLRHLGAAYYESLHGRASAADVARALDSVEEHNGGPSSTTPPAGPAADPAHRPHGGHRTHRSRWHHRVRDVMTTDVITVDRITPYKEIATLLAGHKISSVPVLILGRQVAGIVSEADLLAAASQREQASRATTSSSPLHWRGSHHEHQGLTAAELMTSPAITIHPDATLPAAARLMTSHHLKRLPVVKPDGTLAGIVSRGDLLSVFLRPDQDIATDVTDMLTQVLLAEPGSITVHVHNGIVTLTGQPTTLGEHDLIPIAIRLTWDIDGIVDVVNHIGAASS